VKKPKLKVYEVRWADRNHLLQVWRLRSGPFLQLMSLLGETKRAFVARCAALCRKLAKREHPISLRIFNRDGTISEERTYPRSADPKRSKG
jgi:hypothetical protein